MKILCATDLLGKSDAAVDRAGVLAAQLSAELHLLHVVPAVPSHDGQHPQLREASEKMKERTRSPQWRHGPAPHTAIRIGSPAKTLIQTAEDLRADLIVLGPHAERASSEALSGTIAARMLSERRCPVLIVRQPVQGSYRDVLLALDVRATSPAVIRAAESLVLHEEMSVSVVHSSHFPHTAMLDAIGLTQESSAGYDGKIIDQALKEVRELLARASNGTILYNVVVRNDPPATAIESAARRTHPQLIVMGTRGQGPLRRALLGSVANQVLKSATTDVLVVPEESLAHEKGTWSPADTVPVAGDARENPS